MIKPAPAPKFTTPADSPTLLRLMLGAPNGWGKTFMLGTVGAGNKALIYDTEGGNIVYNKPDDRNHSDATSRENLHIVRFDDFDLNPEAKARDVTHRVESGLDYLIQTKNADGYTLVVVDSLTELQNKFLAHHPATDRRQAYGDWGSELHSIVLKSRQVPTNVIFAAPLQFKEDEVLNRDIVRPALSPAAWSGVAGLFDVLAFGELKLQGPITRRVLTTIHAVRTPGKNRTTIPDSIEDPTVVRLIAAMSGSEGTDAAPQPVPQAKRPGAKFPARS